ncbi:hypothetical protein MKW92_022966 [Papaver armeniacum]|nr:hypothetical protein MKW92_022966 [Papaver armeniacum]
MESLTRRKARPTILIILCLLIIFKLVTTFNSVSNPLTTFKLVAPGLPPIRLRIPAPPPPTPLLHHVFPWY